LGHSDRYGLRTGINHFSRMDPRMLRRLPLLIR
jgi:hypothetical protein